MSAARLGPDGVVPLAVALGDPSTLGRYAAKVVRAASGQARGALDQFDKREFV